MSCLPPQPRRPRLLHWLTAYWGILKWPSLGEFGWPPGALRSLVPATLMWLRVYRSNQPELFTLMDSAAP